jgi:hypothetical protein
MRIRSRRAWQLHSATTPLLHKLYGEHVLCSTDPHVRLLFHSGTMMPILILPALHGMGRREVSAWADSRMVLEYSRSTTHQQASTLSYKTPCRYYDCPYILILVLSPSNLCSPTRPSPHPQEPAIPCKSLPPWSLRAYSNRHGCCGGRVARVALGYPHESRAV